MSTPRTRVSGWRLWIAACWLALAAAPAAAIDLNARLKYFASGGWLPEEDLQRQLAGTPVFDDNLDLRLMLRQRSGDFTWIADHSTTLIRGDAMSFGAGPGVTLDQTVIDDGRRAMDLTWTLDDGDDHRLLHRFDRLAVQYRQRGWGVTVGRQAVSWGNGLVFAPLDLFNPFAPTTVDQDYKAGDDIVLVERALEDGGNLQVLAVARRDADGDLSTGSGSLAGKWHRFVGQGEFELVAARHYDDRVVGMAARRPLGGAMLRSDLVATRLEGGDWRLSGILNLDYSLVWGRRNVYLFGEYFHNGYGVAALPDAPGAYPEALTERLQRGELFNLMRDYLAAGATVEWHALWSQTLTLIGNLHDGSVLLQTQLSHEPGDHQRLELGVVEPLGGAGDEFGGVPVMGEAVTLGGGTRAYLRWAYYF